MGWWPYNQWFPELEFFETESERKRAFKVAGRFGYRWAIVPFFASMVVVVAAARVVMLSLPSVPWWLEASVPATTLPGLGVFWIWILRRRFHKSLRLQLVEKGFAICVNCGYQLRGLTEPRCPECGSPFDAKLLDGMSRRGGRE